MKTQKKIKKSRIEHIGLYFITDSRLTRKSVIEDVKAAIKGGVKVIQYRESQKNTKEMLEEAGRLNWLCKKNKVLFIVNNRVDICMAVGADGVHLGQEDMQCRTARKLLKDKIIGVSTHSIKEAVEAEKCADYISVGPIFYTETKKNAKPVGLKLIKKVKEKIKIPFVAIGGVNKSNLNLVLKSGAKNAAMISAIVAKEDVEKEVKAINNIIHNIYK